MCKNDLLSLFLTRIGGRRHSSGRKTVVELPLHVPNVNWCKFRILSVT